MELFSPGHLIVLAIVIAVLFFGWKQLPDMSRSLGRSLRVFKTEIKGMSDDDKTRDAAKAEQAALEAQPVRAEIVKNEAVKTPPVQAQPVRPVAQPVQAARPAPRPSPSPNKS